MFHHQSPFAVFSCLSSDAREQYKQFYTGQTYASAVKPGTCNKSTQTDDKSTQTDDNITEYKNKNHQRKQKKGTQGKSDSSPHQEKGTHLIMDQPFRRRP